MKILTMYLPQFHQVKENDEWWGAGYTDWVSAKSAKMLFENHYQPHIPQNDYYYDLTDRSTLVWQSELMKKYGIDGQCMYHYWFKDGKQILEKPAEILLASKDIDMPFCFCWANQSWANSWSAVKGTNVWCKDRETMEKDSGNNGLLLEQQYGEKSDWEEHFNYLLPFFKDDRYVKEDGKPLFVLYQTRFIDVLQNMREYWNQLAKQNGFEGIFFIGANCGDNKYVDEILYPAPQFVLQEFKNSNNSYSEMRVLDYDKIWKHIIVNALNNSDGNYGAFVGYDDSPRRGEKGHIIENATPKSFAENLSKIIAINNYHKKSITFINAWNEWGEGMHLEPDVKWGESFLEAVLYAKNKSKEINIDCLKSEYFECDILQDYQNNMERYKSYWKTFDKWLTMHEKGITIPAVLLSRGISSVTIYGLGMIGRHLVNELQQSEVQVICGIDRNSDLKDDFEFEIHSIKSLDNVDKTIDLIIAVSYEFDAIKDELIKCGWKGNILLLEDLFVDK